MHTKLWGNSASQSFVLILYVFNFMSVGVTMHTADIRLQENAMATMNVTDELDYNVAGNAGLTHTGNPKLGEQRTSGNA